MLTAPPRPEDCSEDVYLNPSKDVPVCKVLELTERGLIEKYSSVKTAQVPREKLILGPICYRISDPLSS